AVPGAEGLPLSRQHHRADALVLGKAFEFLGQCHQHRLGQAIARLWPVEGQDCNAADGLPEQQRRSGRRPGLGRRLSLHGFPEVSFISLLVSATATARKALRNAASACALRVEWWLAPWRCDEKQTSRVENQRGAQTPWPRAKRRAPSAHRPTLVAPCDGAQRRADPREGRLHIARSQADCSRRKNLMRAKDELRKQFGKA